MGWQGPTTGTGALEGPPWHKHSWSSPLTLQERKRERERKEKKEGRKERKRKVAQSCLTATTWTVAYQAPLSMEFSRQEYWSGLPFPSSGDLPDPGIESGFPYCRQTLYHLSHQGSPTIEPLQHRAGPQEAEQLPGRECFPTLQQIIGLSFTEQSPDYQFSSVQSLNPV